jgi:hypothetical protein
MMPKVKEAMRASMTGHLITHDRVIVCRAFAIAVGIQPQ